jgi:hypothetical protein
MALPLPRKEMNLTARWKYSSGALHAAFDYGVDIGTPLFAVRRGRILRFRDDVRDLHPDANGQSGDPVNFLMLGIRFRKQPATVLYLHIKQDSIPDELKDGREIEAGTLIARSGHNGNSSGPHFHIAVMKGHDHTNPFAYLSGLSNSSVMPTDGLAANNVTIYPPSLVYTRPRPHPLSSGEVKLAELVFGTKDSDSVRRLQFRLNQISLVGGAELRITGDYTKPTRDELVKWQLQKAGAEPGTPLADGNVHAEQAAQLFGSRYTLV